jgi:hypothetical protein
MTQPERDEWPPWPDEEYRVVPGAGACAILSALPNSQPRQQLRA